MKRNVILSTVAATVVTGVLMMSGCGNSNAPKAGVNYEAEKTIDVVVKSGEKASFTVTTEAVSNNSQAKAVKAKAVVKDVRCVNDKPCETVCTKATPCKVTIQAACGNAAKLNFTKKTDFVGASAAWFNANGNNADVSAVINDPKLIPAFSGSANISQTGGIASCNVDFSSFIVCAITLESKKHAYKSKTNSVDYVMVFVEYDDGTSKWIKVPNTYKSNGVENGQPFFDLKGLGGKLPIKISVMSILKVGESATGSTGSTGTIGAGD